MTAETVEIDTLVVGAGQAGVAMSEHLSKLGVAHLVLERSRIAEAWRTGRWDSLVANGPAWHDRFPGMEFADLSPDAFAGKERVAEYFEAYAQKINAPIRTGVEVHQVERTVGRPGFTVHTSVGVFQANRVVVATGPFQRSVIPAIAPQQPGLQQIHSAQYRNPEQLPAGAVLVVGAGSSGTQIADELQRAGRSVYLSVGQHDRPPRRYRNRDFCWWLGVLGEGDAYIARTGIDLPLEPEARRVFADPACVSAPILSLDLAEAGITTIIWATGFGTDYSWLKVDAFDQHGKPQHQRGVSTEAGLYFLGLPWQSRRGSAFIWGVWHDAKYIAEQIATQRQYLTYRDAAQREAADVDRHAAVNKPACSA